MENKVTLLCAKDPDASDLNVVKIVEFLGGAVRLVHLSGKAFEHGEFFKRSVPVGGCLITSAKTLSKASNQPQSGLRWRQLLMGSAANVLVYGFEPIPSHNLILQELTLSGLLGVESLHSNTCEFRVDRNRSEICRQFAGLTFGTADPDTDLTFLEGTKQNHYYPLIRIGQKPFFVCIKNQGRQLMLLSTREIADLDATVRSNTSTLQFFSGLVPVMMFLFSASPSGFWHNDTPNACFIVDDPLLKRRYGFLDYRKLLWVMESKGFCTSIAFIPYNYRRSSRWVTQLLATQHSRYSLCVHGCDHTVREFGSTNHRLLKDKAQRALDRMELHRQLSGLSFDKIMIFPQGVFSTAAIKALKACGYLAAVNSTAHPIDIGGTLTLKELLEVAVTRYSNFPIFIRRYPRNLAEVAFDLFLGKPALLVEHHDYFRGGYDVLSEFVEKLADLDKRLEWRSLETVCSRACLKRVAESGEVYVKFYADRFFLENAMDRPQQYRLFRNIAPDELLTGVTSNGRSTKFEHENGCLIIPVFLKERQAAEIRLQRGELDESPFFLNPGWIHDSRVFTRRRLSEFRDNYISKSEFLMRAVLILKAALFR